MSKNSIIDTDEVIVGLDFQQKYYDRGLQYS